MFLGAACVVTSAPAIAQRAAATTLGIVEPSGDMCADDSIAHQGDLIGAPPQLVNMDAWPERDFMPEPE